MEWKVSSTTTKLRVVCDASAKSTSGQSLNDVLISGPSLYPKLTTILQTFSSLSADNFRMFREVSLNPEDRDLHRYLVRGDDGKIEDWRMTKLHLASLLHHLSHSNTQAYCSRLFQRASHCISC